LLAVVVGPAASAAVGVRLAGTPAMAADVGAGSIAGLAVIALVAGLAEEPGWRGAAADAWQARMRPVWAAAGIGVLWCCGICR
jgi:membrane protease YdiL (CAAX protease family)